MERMNLIIGTTNPFPTQRRLPRNTASAFSAGQQPPSSPLSASSSPTRSTSTSDSSISSIKSKVNNLLSEIINSGYLSDSESEWVKGVKHYLETHSDKSKRYLNGLQTLLRRQKGRATMQQHFKDVLPISAQTGDCGRNMRDTMGLHEDVATEVKGMLEKKLNDTSVTEKPKSKVNKKKIGAIATVVSLVTATAVAPVIMGWIACGFGGTLMLAGLALATKRPGTISNLYKKMFPTQTTQNKNFKKACRENASCQKGDGCGAMTRTLRTLSIDNQTEKFAHVLFQNKMTQRLNEEYKSVYGNSPDSKKLINTFGCTSTTGRTEPGKISTLDMDNGIMRCGVSSVDPHKFQDQIMDVPRKNANGEEVLVPLKIHQMTDDEVQVKMAKMSGSNAPFSANMRKELATLVFIDKMEKDFKGTFSEEVCGICKYLKTMTDTRWDTKVAAYCQERGIDMSKGKDHVLNQIATRHKHMAKIQLFLADTQMSSPGATTLHITDTRLTTALPTLKDKTGNEREMTDMDRKCWDMLQAEGGLTSEEKKAICDGAKVPTARLTNLKVSCQYTPVNLLRTLDKNQTHHKEEVKKTAAAVDTLIANLPESTEPPDLKDTLSYLKQELVQQSENPQPHDPVLAFALQTQLTKHMNTAEKLISPQDYTCRVDISGCKSGKDRTANSHNRQAQLDQEITRRRTNGESLLDATKKSVDDFKALANGELKSLLDANPNIEQARKDYDNGIITKEELDSIEENEVGKSGNQTMFRLYSLRQANQQFRFNSKSVIKQAQSSSVGGDKTDDQYMMELVEGVYSIKESQLLSPFVGS